jgi:NAD-dependent DNA ligase
MREKSITIVLIYGCPPQIIGRIQHYISRKAMDIEGLGGETVALLFNNDLVHNYADLYKLTVEQILPLERMAQKSADNLVKGGGFKNTFHSNEFYMLWESDM